VVCSHHHAGHDELRLDLAQLVREGARRTGTRPGTRTCTHASKHTTGTTDVGGLTGLEAGDVRRGMLVVAMVAVLAGGCDLVTTPTVSGGPGCRKLVHQDAADYVNFVKLDGITYTADRPVVGRTLRDSDLGPVQATVRCSLRERLDPTRQEPQDGDAAYLDAGSPLYGVHGYRPTFRLAARQDGRLVIFEADTNPRARVGRDLLDLQGKVRRISINSRADGTTELGVITDPKQVAGMVRMLLAGPVDQRVQSAGEQPVRLLAFHLLDGTATVRAYDPADRRVQRGILVPRRFGTLVETAAS
jgi:hypothetical protein